MTSTSTSASRIFHHPYPPRGINNVHGTSCHTSSALQLLFHCFPKVTEALLHLAPISAEYYWLEKCCPAGAVTQQKRDGIEESQREIEGMTNLSSPAEVNRDVEWSRIMQQEFVYQLSWFFHLLAYSEDVLQISKIKARAVIKTRRQQEDIELKAKKKRRKRTNSKETSASKMMSSFQRATIKDFKAKSRAGKLSMDDWELLVMAMKDTTHKIQYSVARSSGMAAPNKEVGGDEAIHANNEITTSSKSINSSANYDDCTTKFSSNSDSIDPTNFYQYLSSHDANFSPRNSNSHNTRRNNCSLAINTNNVGDAAMVFRSLVCALETSVKDELSRLQGVMNKLDRTTGADEKVGQTKDIELNEGQEYHESGSSERQLLSLLKQMQSSMQYSWSGTLVSRIVGRYSTITTILLSNRNDIDPNKLLPQSTTASTTLQRTKKNGNIERSLPVPFPLPVVINRQNKSDGTFTNYFQNLEQAFHSVTIEPIPIRGYDWSELIQRGEVVEEQLVTQLNEEKITFVQGELTGKKREIEDEEILQTECYSDIKAEDTCTEGTGENDIELSRSIACQTDFSRNDIGTQTFTEETTLMEVHSGNQQQQDNDVTTNLPAAKLGIEQKSCYAAAVTALVMLNQSNSVASRHSRVRRQSLNRSDSVESRVGHCQINASAGSDGSNVMGMENGTLSGMEIDALSEEDVQEDDKSMANESQSPSESSSSEEESSVDSHVSSVNTDTSSEENGKEGDDNSFSTRSSDIETPPDIDNISLGSFTDSEPQFDDNATRPMTAPAVNIEHDKAIDREESLDTNDNDNAQQLEESEVGQPILHTSSIDIDESALLANCNGDELSVAKDTEENQDKTEDDPSATTTAALIDFDSDDMGAIRCSADDCSSSSTTSTSSASSTSNSTSSYSSTDNTSSSDSSRSSSEESSSSTSDDDYDDNDNVDNPPQDKNAAEWVTRKETRLCLPLPQSLIFHLKRFEYSATKGQVQKLAGEVDIPHRLNVRACCLDTTSTAARHDITTSARDKKSNNMNSCCYEYFLSGAIVHIDPSETEDEIEFGSVSEGHYVTLLHSPPSSATSTEVYDPNHVEREVEVGAWTEIDDDMIRIVDPGSETNAHHRRHPALDDICGCNKYNNAASNIIGREDCRYAMLLVYSRHCQCYNIE